jgi:aldehyde:ferredoxin oxidoreductase
MGSGIGSGLTEAATFCIFASTALNRTIGSNEEIARQYLNAACGWDLSAQDVADIALRNHYFNRSISLREGYHPSKDDYLPPRAFDEPITDKYGKTWVWGRDEFEHEKKKFYVNSLKLTEGGLPPRGGLEGLGLGFVIPTLEAMGALG